MARGKSIKKLLLDASQSALFAGIEIHNKPNIAYRYPTATILIVNAWELALKAYIYQYIGKKKIYERDGKLSLIHIWGTKATLAYSGVPFAVPDNLYIIGMMNTADRSLAMIDYARRRRFSFFEMEPGFDSEGFQSYQSAFSSEIFDALIDQIRALNREISKDPSLGRGFRIGHSYFCGRESTDGMTDWLRSVVEFDILPTLAEYWFDEPATLQRWEKNLRGVFDDE